MPTFIKMLCFKEKMFQDLAGTSVKLFRNLKNNGEITKNFKKTTNLGKLCLLAKGHKGLSEVPDGPVISNRHSYGKSF